MINTISSVLTLECWADVHAAKHVDESYIVLGFLIYNGRTVLWHPI